MSQPTADTIDDILYCARYGEFDELKNANFPAEYFAAADETGNTALHMACANGHLGKRYINILAELGKPTVPLINLFTVGSKIDIVKYVVEKLASLDNVTQYINSQNEQGNTPLHWAALNGHLEIVQLLVSSYGADMKVSITNTDDQQPGL